MAKKKEIANKLPPGTADTARVVWNRLSPADRRAIEEVVEAFPSQSNLINLLLKLASGQIKTAFGSKHRVAIVGPTNVGKSTLYNQLVRRKEDRAEVSPLPGTTRQNQWPMQACSPSLIHLGQMPPAKPAKTSRPRPSTPRQTQIFW